MFRIGDRECHPGTGSNRQGLWDCRENLAARIHFDMLNKAPEPFIPGLKPYTSIEQPLHSFAGSLLKIQLVGSLWSCLVTGWTLQIPQFLVCELKALRSRMTRENSVIKDPGWSQTLVSASLS